MSDRPVIFLAHSSADKNLARKLKDALLARLGDDYEVFFDADSIAEGEDWSEKIEVNLAECTAAILLLTPSAKTAPYMPHEGYLLSLRKRFDPDLLLLPLFARGFRGTELTAAESPFRYARLETWNASELSDANVDAVADQLAAALQAGSRRSPWVEVERETATCLTGVAEGPALDQAAATLKDLIGDVRGYQLVADKRRWLARRLFGLSLKDLATFVRKLSAFFMPPSERDALVQQLLRAVIPFVWVPDESARILHEQAKQGPPRKTVSLNCRTLPGGSGGDGDPAPGVPAAGLPHIPDLFVRRASATSPPWSMRSAPADWSQDTLTDLDETLRDIARELLGDVFNDLDDDALKAGLIEQYADRGETVIVVLPEDFAKLDAPQLERMTQFCRVFTLLLTTDTYRPELRERFANLVQLPELSVDEQRALMQGWKYAIPAT